MNNDTTVTMTINGEEAEYVRKDSVSDTVIKMGECGGLASTSVGMKVLVRSRNEGVNAGIVEAADETGIILKNARRLWYHRPKNSGSSWYEGVALTGVSDSSKVSDTVPRKFLIEDYSIIPCKDEAFASIMEKKPHAQS